MLRVRVNKINKTQVFPNSNHNNCFHFTDILVRGKLLTV